MSGRALIPVDRVCLHCGEAVADDDLRSPAQNGPLHLECFVRALVGGVNHQAGTCTCCGGRDPPDPPGLSRREAAILARHRYEQSRRRPCP